MNHDLIDGKKLPQLVTRGDHLLEGTHTGSVKVESGVLTLRGVLRGSLAVEADAAARIEGKVQGSVSVAAGATVIVIGSIEGSVHLDPDATVEVEESGRLAGSLHNDGRVVVRGVFGGSRSGNEPLLEGSGYIKEPRIEGDSFFYVWD